MVDDQNTEQQLEAWESHPVWKALDDAHRISCDQYDDAFEDIIADAMNAVVGRIEHGLVAPGEDYTGTAPNPLVREERFKPPRPDLAPKSQEEFSQRIERQIQEHAADYERLADGDHDAD